MKSTLFLLVLNVLIATLAIKATLSVGMTLAVVGLAQVLIIGFAVAALQEFIPPNVE